jgi:phosphoglucomutase
MNPLLENAQLSDEAKSNIQPWLTDDKFSFYRQDVEKLLEDGAWEQLEDGFFQVLPFGTGGRRGTCGIGSNRVNRITIGETVQALCDYLKDTLNDTEDIKIGIAHDCRLTSDEFAQYCARVVAGNGLKAYTFDGPRATPELSFAVRELGLTAGIVITASHNPSSDNGIKLYWSDGGQIVAPHDKEILSRASKVAKILEVTDADELSSSVTVLSEEFDKKYWSAAQSCIQSDNRDLKIAYSPLHGTGITSVYPVLKQSGFEVLLYENQANMDGNFTNVTNNIPNPEVPAANDKVSDFAIKNNCDIATTNDPDADRFCIIVIKDGQAIQLNGNQTAVLMTDYVLESMKKRNELTSKHFIASTIVTTDMLLKIAESYGINAISNLLVGFKYIGEQINLRHDEGDEIFVCGGEESYGGIIGDYCRDKDAAGPTAAVAELAADLKKEGKTLLDKMDELYVKHGYFHEDLHSITFPGAEGFKAMKQFMTNMRENPPKTIGGNEVLNQVDYSTGEVIKGKKENVLRFEFSSDGHNRITIRPSGTEPKIKIYTQAYTPVEGSIEETKNKTIERVEAIKNEIIKAVELSHE